MSNEWIKIDDLVIKTNELPAYLDRYNILPTLLRKFIESKYTSPIKPSKEEQINYYKKFLNDNKINSNEELLKWLDDRGLDEKRMTMILYDSMKVERFKYEKFEDKVKPIFLNSKKYFDRVMYSLIRVKSRDEINELYLKLEEDGAIFSELASEYSQGVEKKFNGLLGPMELGKLNPELAERLRSSKKGQLWPPFQSQGWWVLLRYEKLIPAQLDNSMKTRIVNELYENWMKENILPLIKTIRKNNNTPISSSESDKEFLIDKRDKNESLFSYLKRVSNQYKENLLGKGENDN